MDNVLRGYQVAFDGVETSGILEGYECELVMAGEIFVYESDSHSSAVDKGMDGNIPIANIDIE